MCHNIFFQEMAFLQEISLLLQCCFIHLMYRNIFSQEMSFFTGNIPFEIWGLNNLERLSLGGNQLTGNVSSQIGDLLNLEMISEGTMIFLLKTTLFL